MRQVTVVASIQQICVTQSAHCGQQQGGCVLAEHAKLTALGTRDIEPRDRTREV